jgi:uncharacterized protein (DUF305 family)
MKLKLRSAIALILIPASAFSAWQSGSHSHTQKTTTEPYWSEFQGSMEKMHVAMGSIEPSGDSSVDFAKMMLPHHQAAIEMARTQLQYGKDPQVRRLAQEIITDQQSEIDLMRLWLKNHQPGLPDPNQAGLDDPPKEE